MSILAELKTLTAIWPMKTQLKEDGMNEELQLLINEDYHV